MTNQQIMEPRKVRSEVEDLTADEREVFEAFLQLAETRYDVGILSRVWLKMHHRGVLGMV